MYKRFTPLAPLEITRTKRRDKANKSLTGLEITKIRRRDKGGSEAKALLPPKENKSLTGFNVPKKVVVGGTFDILHEGHKALLRKAYELGEVLIGLTSDAMARKRKRRKIEDFKYRKKELEGFVKKEFNVKPRSEISLLRGKPKIVKIEDKLGPTLKEDFDYIVVSPKTYKTALLINKERQKRNKKPIKIVKIKFVLAEDGKPISSTRILKGGIDRNGNLLR